MKIIEKIKSDISHGSFEDSKGKLFEIKGSITLSEVDFFVDLIKDNDVKVILDIGVGKGISTALFSSLIGETGLVIGIDPFQSVEHDNSVFKYCDYLGAKHPTLIEKKSIETILFMHVPNRVNMN